MGVYFTQLAPLQLEGGTHLGPILHGEVDHQRNHGEKHQCQRHIHPDQYDERNDDFNRRDEILFRTVVGEFRNVEQVRGDSGNQLTDFVLTVVGVGQFLEVAEQVPPHVRLNQRAHYVARVLHVVVGQHVHPAKYQIQRRQAHHHVDGEVGRMVGYRVGDKPDDDRQHQVANAGEGGTNQVKNKNLFIRAEVRHEPLQQIPGGQCMVLHSFSSLSYCNKLLYTIVWKVARIICSTLFFS